MHRLAVLVVVGACDLVPPPASAPNDAAPDVSSIRIDAAAPVSRDATPTGSPPAPAASPTTPPVPSSSTPAAALPGAAGSLATATHPAAPELIVAAPSQAIRALAVTQDGTVAVASDVDGGVRLWPALDGTREPVVVAMRRPVILAIEHDGDGLAIAGIDGAGQLELTGLSALGEPRHRVDVELPRPAIDVRATPFGFLVERDDQRLVLVSMGGAIAGDVEPPPGDHVAAIAVRGEGILALLARADGVHGRWLLHINNGLAWGAETPALPIAARGIALSANQKRIAAVIDDDKTTRLAIIDLARGKRVLLGPDNGFVDPQLEPLGFLDGETVVVRSSGTLTLWHASADDNSVAGLAEQRQAPAIAIGGSHAVMGSFASLTLADRDGTLRYLGFRAPSVTMVAGGGYSLLASDGNHLMRLGADLREHTSYELPHPHGDGYDVSTVLDGNHVLVQSYRQQQYVDIIALDTMQVTPVADETRLIAYDAAHRIAAFSEPTAVRFRRFDGKTGTFGKSAELAVGSAGASVELTDEGGAYVTTTADTTYTVRTVRAIRPERGSLKVTHTRTGELQIEGEDGEGVSVPPAPVLGHTVRSPDGTLAASYGDGRLTLRDAKGAVRWTVPTHGASELVWLRTGELLATGGGLARIDLDTGAFAERRCGWEFGLWPEAIDSFASGRLCDAE